MEEALLLLQHNLRRGSLVSEIFVDAQSVHTKKRNKNVHAKCAVFLCVVIVSSFSLQFFSHLQKLGAPNSVSCLEQMFRHRMYPFLFWHTGKKKKNRRFKLCILPRTDVPPQDVPVFFLHTGKKMKKSAL